MREKIFDKRIWIIATIFIMWVAVFSLVWPMSGDDLFYYNTVNENGLLQAWYNQVGGWSARFIIELLQFTFYTLPNYEVLFRIFNSALFTLMAYCLLKYCDGYVAERKMFVFATAIFIYPIDILGSAGWLATSANYLWPIAFGMYAMLPVVFYLKEKKIQKHYYILSTFAMIFACNEEQVSALLFALLACIIVYLVIKEHKIPKYCIFLDFIALSLMVFSLTWRGSSRRMESEILTWNPVFNMQGTLEKLVNGFLSTTYYLLQSSSIMMVLMCIMLALVIRTKYEDKIIRGIGWIPAIFFGLFGTFKEITLQIFPAFKQLYILDLDATAAFNADVIVSASIQIFIILLIAANCVWAFKGKRKGILLGLLWLGGIATRVIMGLSPTLYASSTRTFSCLSIIIIIIYVMLLNECELKNKNILTKATIIHMILWIYLFYLV